MIDVPDQNVFVAIAAYREPELRRTIENCIITAAHPERLRFGVCLQYDRSGPPETHPDCLDGIDATIRLVSHDWTESKGGLGPATGPKASSRARATPSRSIPTCV